MLIIIQDSGMLVTAAKHLARSDFICAVISTTDIPIIVILMLIVVLVLDFNDGCCDVCVVSVGVTDGRTV